MHNKHLTRLWIALVFASLASGTYLLLPNKTVTPKLPSPTPIAQNIPWSNIVTNTTLVASEQKKEIKQPDKNNPNLTIKTIPETTTTILIPEKNTLNVTIIINGQNHSLTVFEKSTAYDAMIKLVTDKKITAVFREFSGLGYFVDEIDDIKTDKNAGKYWIYLINGKPAQTGISNYILKNNDSITWKYEVPQF